MQVPFERMKKPGRGFPLPSIHLYTTLALQPSRTRRNVNQMRSELAGRIAYRDNDDGFMFLVNAENNGVILDKKLPVSLSCVCTDSTLRAAIRHGFQGQDLVLQRVDEFFRRSLL